MLEINVIMRWKPRIFPWNVPKWNVLLQFLLPFFFSVIAFDTNHCDFWFALHVSLMTKQLRGKCCLHLPPRGPKVDKDMGLWQHQKNIVKSFFHHLTRAMVKFHFSNTNSSRDLWNAIEFVNILWSSLYNLPVLLGLFIRLQRFSLWQLWYTLLLQRTDQFID